MEFPSPEILPPVELHSSQTKEIEAALNAGRVIQLTYTVVTKSELTTEDVMKRIENREKL